MNAPPTKDTFTPVKQDGNSEVAEVRAHRPAADRATLASPRAASHLGHSEGVPCAAPDWNISPSPFDWQVMIYGGVNPRNGIEWLPLEFQFFGKFYSASDIERRAADLCEREHRTHFTIRPPADKLFIRGMA